MACHSWAQAGPQTQGPGRRSGRGHTAAAALGVRVTWGTGTWHPGASEGLGLRECPALHSFSRSPPRTQPPGLLAPLAQAQSRGGLEQGPQRGPGGPASQSRAGADTPLPRSARSPCPSDTHEPPRQPAARHCFLQSARPILQAVQATRSVWSLLNSAVTGSTHAHACTRVGRALTELGKNRHGPQSGGSGLRGLGRAWTQAPSEESVPVHLAAQRATTDATAARGKPWAHRDADARRGPGLGTPMA